MSRLDSLLLILAGLAAPCMAGTGDPVMGRTLFNQCAACHSIESGGPNQTGPNLHGVLGKAAGTNQPGFEYSAALRASGLTWDDATLDAWIKDPAALVPHTKMTFAGFTKKEKRDDVIAYLKQAAVAP